jgi:hypothetical protein
MKKPLKKPKKKDSKNRLKKYPLYNKIKNLETISKTMRKILKKN